jgi:glutamate carboxypeptidase
MKTNSARPLLTAAQSRLKETVAFIRRLVEHESPSFNKDAVDALGRILAAEFERRGGQVKVHRAKKFGNHLQADFPGGRGKPVLLLGHFDTVYELGTLPRGRWPPARSRRA